MAVDKEDSGPVDAPVLLLADGKHPGVVAHGALEPEVDDADANWRGGGGRRT